MEIVTFAAGLLLPWILGIAVLAASATRGARSMRPVRSPGSSAPVILPARSC